MTDLLQHRHYTKMASIIASLPSEMRHLVADHFTENLYGTNSNFSGERFYKAAMGNPINGRDR